MSSIEFIKLKKHDTFYGADIRSEKLLHDHLLKFFDGSGDSFTIRQIEKKYGNNNPFNYNTIRERLAGLVEDGKLKVKYINGVAHYWFITTK